jgi:hypothetical protein
VLTVRRMRCGSKFGVSVSRTITQLNGMTGLGGEVSKLVFVVGVFLALALGAALLEKSRKRAQSSHFEGQVQPARLMHDQELALYRTLVTAFPDQLVFCQVALSQIVGLRTGAPRALTNRYFRLVADFVICSQNASPIAVLELDGRLHRKARQTDRDSRKDAVLNAAGIPVFRISSTKLPDAQELRALVSYPAPARQPVTV